MVQGRRAKIRPRVREIRKHGSSQHPPGNRQSNRTMGRGHQGARGVVPGCRISLVQEHPWLWGGNSSGTGKAPWARGCCQRPGTPGNASFEFQLRELRAPGQYARREIMVLIPPPFNYTNSEITCMYTSEMFPEGDETSAPGENWFLQRKIGCFLQRRATRVHRRDLSKDGLVSDSSRLILAHLFYRCPQLPVFVMIIIKPRHFCGHLAGNEVQHRPHYFRTADTLSVVGWLAHGGGRAIIHSQTSFSAPQNIPKSLSCKI
ncbi:hypothetical protein B0H19DRAFT_186324 [Mycena capillaripes]|nr:hypothetical protein B0H19DRAFT_186324 [Mycena capillaripes]